MNSSPTNIDVVTLCRCLKLAKAGEKHGASMCWMLMMIAEHDAPLLINNDEMQQLCGFGSKQRLVNARDKAIRSGWLRYAPGTRHHPGRYMVCVPLHVTLLDLAVRKRDVKTSQFTQRQSRDGERNQTESASLKFTKVPASRASIR